MKKYLLIVMMVTSLGGIASAAYAGCEIVDGDRKTPFDGKTLDRLKVDKKSLTSLNKEFPSLNVIEKTFKGELITCSDCTEKYIVCSRDPN